MKLIKHGRWSYTCCLCNRKLRVVRCHRDHFHLQCPGCGQSVNLPRSPSDAANLFPRERRKASGR